ncbi:MAG: SigE family RNA polymerase sigma factor [Actinomycetota bacterium]|nr:SigE family RNA polymerase sigma factor [Actinomycetota bacterium]
MKERPGAGLAGVPDRDEELTALFDQHYKSLRGLAFVMLGDSAGAEEVVMEAYLKAFSTWNRFRRLDHPHAYLRQIVVNLCRSRFRRAKVEHRVNALMHRAEDVAPDLERELRMDLWDAVRRLPERQRACVVLRYLEDMTEPEIADVLECSVGTVKSQLFKAKTKLERELAASTGGDRRD